MGTISAIALLGCLVSAFTAAYCLACKLSSIRRRQLLQARRRIETAARLWLDRLCSLSIVSKPLRRWRDGRRAEEIQNEMPEVLRLMCIALESGSSMTAAIRYAAENSEGVLSRELERAVWDLEAGQGFNEALEKLRSRTGGSEFAFLAVAMEIQHQSGGSMADILDNVSSLLKQSSDLKTDLRTKTAQGRLSSRIVALMPFILLAVLSLFSPGYLGDFLASPLGVCLFAVALLLELLGVVLVRRALSVDCSAGLEGSA